MSFKFLRGNNENMFLQLEPIQQLVLTRNGEYRHTNNEFCFQFDDDEPFVFASGNDNLSLNISPTAGGNISFTRGGKTFKIFARDRNDT